MYKQKQKEKFISYYLRTRVIEKNTPSTIFTFTESFEERNGKDISLFTKQEILEVLKAKKYRAFYSAQNMVTLLKHYTEYIKGTGKENVDENHFTEISKDEIYSCLDLERVNSLVLSREEIDEIETHMFNYTDKAILECLFSGIYGSILEDLTGLCEEQLDRNGKRIIFPDGRILNISNKLCYLLIKAFEETEMVSYGDTFRVSKMNGYGCLYKEKNNAYKEANLERKFRWVLRRVVIWRDYFNIPTLTMKTISLSGLVHAIKDGMKDTGLSLREYTRSKDGENLARKWGIKAKDYTNVVYEKVRWYIEE